MSNAHLQSMLREFDKQYGPAKYHRLGRYTEARALFAESLAKNLVDLSTNDPN